eukprot:CAMPEP_0194258490 /NCGR_PEP_ID=MMETSP0158-20130606/41451_1 /TAXON_ID=33649 /ORGANISM="Thalassionema nitzschioides, Strain L26-B" /LENGTH=53 /DNA_ID=CAMNT_0038997931 /DNA_START=1 /DNA_END=159 /DNA_ORIENTATION=-
MVPNLEGDKLVRPQQSSMIRQDTDIDSLVTVNAGGRHFLTATNTLASSGAGFF